MGKLSGERPGNVSGELKFLKKTAQPVRIREGINRWNEEFREL